MSAASIVCGCLAFLMAAGGFFTTGLPVVGSILSFGSPIVALVGIVTGGVGLSRAKQTGEGEGASITGLVISIISFVIGLLVAVTCGLCNACFTAGAAGAAGTGAAVAGGLPSFPAPQPGAGGFGGGSAGGGSAGGGSGSVPPFPSATDPSAAGAMPAPPAPIEGETDAPVHPAFLLKHLNLRCHAAWCAPESRDYLFTGASCNASECALHFTAYRFDRDLPGPFQGEVRVPRDAIRPDPADAEQVLPAPLDAALSPALDAWQPAPGAEPAGTRSPVYAFVEWANDMCPDGWCEGEVSYDYRHVACAGDTCTLTFRYSAEEDWDEATETMRWRVGEMEVPMEVIESAWNPDRYPPEPAMDRFLELTDAWAAEHTGG